MNLLVISVLITKATNSSQHISIELQKTYSVGESTLMVIFKKYQVFIIYAMSCVFDITISFYKGESPNRIIVGYALLLIPLVIFLNPSGWDTLNNAKVKPNLTVSFSSTILSVLALLMFEFEYYNVKMVFISFGSLLILTFSQLDLDESTSHKTFFNKNQFLANYKTNLAILNVVMIVIQHICLNGDTNFTDSNFVSKFIKEDFFHLLVTGLFTFIIKPTGASGETKSESIEQESETKKTGTSFFSLLYQMFHSKELKSIFNFLLLNISFMFIQLFIFNCQEQLGKSKPKFFIWIGQN
ncbi:unnamed protein product [Ambrosiozyma monospora]|uniref:Unnamed protein product n=1 Tax=Ambrosiozyma monospora TaxID=43982 RepID=A0ACB5TTI4_AMBMO|nr:unnamed protein product [Ambrosiozyma monospora]